MHNNEPFSTVVFDFPGKRINGHSQRVDAGFDFLYVFFGSECVFQIFLQMV
jgi:hypothetical protein